MAAWARWTACWSRSWSQLRLRRQRSWHFVRASAILLSGFWTTPAKKQFNFIKVSKSPTISRMAFLRGFYKNTSLHSRFFSSYAGHHQILEPINVVQNEHFDKNHRPCKKWNGLSCIRAIGFFRKKSHVPQFLASLQEFSLDFCY